MNFIYNLISAKYNVWQMRNAYYKFNNTFLKRLFYKSYYYKFSKLGSYIDLNTEFANIPLFPHDLNGIFISGGAKIGKNAIIFQQVTIGSNSLPDSKSFGAPTIGDNCYIGAGAKIIGNVLIGNNYRIGANCTVTFDMEDNSVAVAQKAFVIKKNEIINKFYTKINNKWHFWDKGKWIFDKNFEK